MPISGISVSNFHILNLIHAGLAPVPEYMLEKIIEALETTCYENMQNTKKNTIGLGVEFDENSVCNVCQSVSTV